MDLINNITTEIAIILASVAISFIALLVYIYFRNKPSYKCQHENELEHRTSNGYYVYFLYKCVKCGKLTKAAIMLSLILCLGSCGDVRQGETYNQKKEYIFKVEYQNGDIDTISYKDEGKNIFVLDEGDLRNYYNNRNVASFVRRFEVIEIKKLK